MNAKSFFELVGNMRAAQSESKQLEKAVDAEIQRVNEIIKGQPIARDLFD